jgi:tRNA threonylcarbamoyl adenosine modification protein YeaZ
MRVLAIDTALEACSAVLFDTAAGVIAQETQVMARGHAEALMPLIRRVVGRTNRFNDIDRIAVTVGPGSFTGLRVGLAAARGIGLAAGKPVVGLSTLSVFAAPFIAADSTQPVAAAVDARHGHVYLQIFGAGGRTLMAPRLADLREAVQRAAASGAPRLAGNAADAIAAAWPADEPAPAAIDAQGAPDIIWVGRLGAVAEDTGVPPKPLYLRPPDAQPQTAAHLPRR